MIRNVFLLGSTITLFTALLDDTAAVTSASSGVAVTVLKGGEVKASGQAISNQSGIYRFSYHPSQWETGDYLMRFEWTYAGASGSAEGRIDLPFKLVASQRELTQLRMVKRPHPCDFPWYQAINMECEIDEILSKQGKWFVLWKKTSNENCTCWTPANGTAAPSCPYCRGEGYPHREVPLLAREEAVDRSGGIIPLGRQLTWQKKFFVSSDVQLRKGDQIWQVRWNDPSNPSRGWQRPPEIQYAVLFVHDFRGDDESGASSYREVHVEELSLRNSDAELT